MKNWMRLAQMVLVAFAAVVYQQPQAENGECTICKPAPSSEQVDDNSQMSRRRV